ncbi:MAG TPA: YceI family protein [Polyangiaceae bacterium]|jgi:polyisoprenoid-binding protein YceI|nr:YceI family protein [Polyangiaceae bacterium]
MTTYTVDYQHSDVSFSVRHMVFAKVRGHFTKWTADLAFDPASPTAASLNVTIDATSIDTREAQRDGHLKSPDFLDVEKYPQITFKSTKVQKTGDKKYAVTGDLTIHGTTNSVNLDVEELGGGKDPWGNQRIAFAAKTRIDRKEFGLKWNQALETGGVLVGDHIDIDIDVEAIAKPA